MLHSKGQHKTEQEGKKGLWIHFLDCFFLIPERTKNCILKIKLKHAPINHFYEKHTVILPEEGTHAQISNLVVLHSTRTSFALICLAAELGGQQHPGLYHSRAQQPGREHRAPTALLHSHLQSQVDETNHISWEASHGWVFFCEYWSNPLCRSGSVHAGGNREWLSLLTRPCVSWQRILPLFCFVYLFKDCLNKKFTVNNHL